MDHHRSPSLAAVWEDSVNRIAQEKYNKLISCLLSSQGSKRKKEKNNNLRLLLLLFLIFNKKAKSSRTAFLPQLLFCFQSSSARDRCQERKSVLHMSTLRLLGERIAGDYRAAHTSSQMEHGNMKKKFHRLKCCAVLCRRQNLMILHSVAVGLDTTLLCYNSVVCTNGILFLLFFFSLMALSLL